ncbi:MAG: FUSC family protein [Parachlamydiales bacterium]|nr:FUSC family protein [Parachlamydiales bacterium]
MSKFLKRLDWKLSLKIAIGSAISYYLTVMLNKALNQPLGQIGGLWAVISTTLIIQTHLGGSYRAAWIRFLGTVIGVIIGASFTRVFEGNALWLGIAILCTSLLTNLFGLKDTTRLSCFTAALVMILWSLTPNENPWLYGLFRIIDSVIGIVIGVLISIVLWPIKGHQLIINELDMGYKSLNQAYTSNQSTELLNDHLFRSRVIFNESSFEYTAKVKQELQNSIHQLEMLSLQLQNIQQHPSIKGHPYLFKLKIDTSYLLDHLHDNETQNAINRLNETITEFKKSESSVSSSDQLLFSQLCLQQAQKLSQIIN